MIQALAFDRPQETVNIHWNNAGDKQYLDSSVIAKKLFIFSTKNIGSVPFEAVFHIPQKIEPCIAIEGMARTAVVIEGWHKRISLVQQLWPINFEIFDILAKTRCRRKTELLESYSWTKDTQKVMELKSKVSEPGGALQGQNRYSFLTANVSLSYIRNCTDLRY